mgnify:CR=1 FL=1
MRDKEIRKSVESVKKGKDLAATVLQFYVVVNRILSTRHTDWIGLLSEECGDRTSEEEIWGHLFWEWNLVDRAVESVKHAEEKCMIDRHLWVEMDKERGRLAALWEKVKQRRRDAVRNEEEGREEAALEEVVWEVWESIEAGKTLSQVRRSYWESETATLLRTSDRSENEVDEMIWEVYMWAIREGETVRVQ